MIGWTLGRYFAARFLTLILAVFLTICGMVFVVDFVELLRRTSDIGGVSARSIAILSLLRAPSASEQLMPFCVLCGSMAAFLDLTRKLELLVARAVGVSVWGFLVPPVAIAILIGVASVTLFNPVSALMKQRAEVLEAQIFGDVCQQRTRMRVSGSGKEASTARPSSRRGRPQGTAAASPRRPPMSTVGMAGSKPRSKPTARSFSKGSGASTTPAS